MPLAQNRSQRHAISFRRGANRHADNYVHLGEVPHQTKKNTELPQSSVFSLQVGYFNFLRPRGFITADFISLRFVPSVLACF